MSERIAVGLGARSYDIHVGAGLTARAGESLAPFAHGVTPIVTDENVAKLHLGALVESLRAAGIDARPVIVAAGEATKSFAGLERLTSALLNLGVERGGLIVALGGGVIGDLAGFAAGILKRGIDFAQIPTTLLAQVDSSVGGKTAINTPEGKNLVGLFHQPRIVIADTEVLTTLPKREWLAGYAEVAKYGALGDPDFFAWLETNGAAALKGDEAALIRIVAHHDLRLDLAGAVDRKAQSLDRPAQQRVDVRFDPVEKIRIADQAVFDDLGQAGAQIPVRQALQQVGIGDHRPRLMKRADHVLAAHGGVHMRQQRGRHLHQVHAALIAGGDEARQIAYHTAAERHHHGVTPDAIGNQHVEYTARRGQRLVLLAIGQDDFRCRGLLQRLLERIRVQPRDHRVTDQHHVAARELRCQQLARTQQSGTDQDRV